MPIIGAQVSAAGGAYNAVERGQEITADAIMIFGASPRQWAVKMPAKEDVERFKKDFKASGLHSLWLHAPYLINLGSANGGSRNRSVALLAKHLKIGEMLGAKGTIFHVGSANGGSMDDALKHSIDGVKKVLAKVPGKSQLVMENAAGGGTKIGSAADELGAIMKGVKSKRLKVCIDTAHAFEAGDIDYTPKSTKDFFDRWEKACGKGSIVVLHANDSKTAFDSHNDRHENIGKGYIGIQGFKNLVKDNRVKDLPWLLEVPGYKNEGPDKKNVEVLKKTVG